MQFLDASRGTWPWNHEGQIESQSKVAGRICCVRGVGKEHFPEASQVPDLNAVDSVDNHASLKHLTRVGPRLDMRDALSVISRAFIDVLCYYIFHINLIFRNNYIPT